MLKQQAISDIEALKYQCFSFLDDYIELMNSQIFASLNTNIKIAILPIIYSIWERFFTNGSSILLNYLIHKSQTNKKLSTELKALLLLHEPEFNKFYDKIFSISIKNKSKITDTKFNNLAEFLIFYDAWNLKTPSINANEKYIMTFSNVDEKVLKLHEKLFLMTHIDNVNDSYKIAKLGEIVGVRNEISHGGLITYRGDANIKESLNFIKDLISKYSESLISKVGL